MTRGHRWALWAVAWVGVAEMAGALVCAVTGVALAPAIFAYGCGLVAWAEASARADGGGQ